MKKLAVIVLAAIVGLGLVTGAAVENGNPWDDSYPSQSAPADKAAASVHARAVDDVSPLFAWCTTGRIEVNTTAVNIRNAPYVDAPILTVGHRGDQYDCSTYVLGDRYNACGQSQGNGWVAIPFREYYGYAVQACFNDV